MKTEEALNRHFVAAGIYAEGCTRESRYPAHLVSLQLGHWQLPIFPILDRSGPIVLHDIHHMLTGYPTTWTGEAEIAGWEVASGGCRWHLLYWLDRLSFLVIGLVIAPRATWRAWRHGKGQRNLYGLDPEEVLETDVAELECYVGT